VVLEYALRFGSNFYLYFAQIILVFFPNLESLNLKNLVATTATIDLNVYYMAYLMSLIYTIIILGLAAWAFEKKSFDAV
jgi:ABC-type transport system involved in multi-copper enzyme maturation permease subunit